MNIKLKGYYDNINELVKNMAKYKNIKLKDIGNVEISVNYESIIIAIYDKNGIFLTNGLF